MLHPVKRRAQRGHEIAAYDRHIGYLRNYPDRHLLGQNYLKRFFKIRLTLMPARTAAEKNVQRELVLMLGIYSVSRKTPAEAVRPVVHGYHAPNHAFSVYGPAFS